MYANNLFKNLDKSHSLLLIRNDIITIGGYGVHMESHICLEECISIDIIIFNYWRQFII